MREPNGDSSTVLISVAALVRYLSNRDGETITEWLLVSGHEIRI